MSFLRGITSKPDIVVPSTSSSTSAPASTSASMKAPDVAASASATASTVATAAAAPRVVVEGDSCSSNTVDTLDGDNVPSTSNGQCGRYTTPLVGPDFATPASTCAFRVRRELNEIRKNPPPNCSAEMCMDRLLHWTATVIGPAGSVYEGGHFKLDIRFPLNYPFRPPRIRFTTFIYHCNVDSVGAICLDVLNERWSPVMNVSKVLLSIWLLLGECNPEDPLVMCIADQYKSNRQEHDRVARFWTKRFAMPKEAKEVKDSKKPKDPKEPKKPKDPNESKKPKDLNEPKKPKDLTEPNDPKHQNNPREPM